MPIYRVVMQPSTYKVEISPIAVRKVYLYLLTARKLSSSTAFTISNNSLGEAWGWGYNVQGQLGDNSLSSNRVPIIVSGTTKTFCEIGTGYRHSLALDFRGQAWAWGANTYGGLGINSIAAKSTPVAVGGTNKTFCKIEGGYYHSLAIDLRGFAWAWGYNNNGQLGNNSTTSVRTPIPVLGNHTFCQISFGRYWSKGLDYKGQIWSWGENGNGQMGDNTSVNKCIPTLVGGVNKTFCKITGGSTNSLAIDFRGMAWGWGYNNFGQIGDNTTVAKSTPFAVFGNKTFCSISAKDTFTVAIDYLGKAWTWGYNKNGELGDNTSNNCKCVPTAVYGSHTFCQISAGANFCVAIDNHDKVWSWGLNSSGCIGNGTLTCYSIPVAVCNI